MSSSTGVGPIDQSLLPAAVRNGTAEDRKAYDAALGFERLLVSQLSKQLTATAQGTEDEDGGDAASSTYKAMLPDALTDGLMQAGGLGLAASLYTGLAPKEAT